MCLTTGNRVYFYKKNAPYTPVEASLFGEYAQGTNSYSVFLHGDLPLVRIDTELHNGRSIAVVKESYGNAFVPFLVNHYHIFMWWTSAISIEPARFIRQHEVGSFCSSITFCGPHLLSDPVSGNPHDAEVFSVVGRRQALFPGEALTESSSQPPVIVVPDVGNGEGKTNDEKNSGDGFVSSAASNGCRGQPEASSASSAEIAQAPPRILNIAVSADTHAHTKEAMRLFAQKLEEISQGCVKAELFEAVDPLDLLWNTKDYALAVVSSGQAARADENYRIFDLPFMFRDYRQATMTANSTYFSSLATGRQRPFEEAERWGLFRRVQAFLRLGIIWASRRI